jgi:hypothetical protein
MSHTTILTLFLESSFARYMAASAFLSRPSAGRARNEADI